MKLIYNTIKKFYYTRINPSRLITVHVSGRIKPADKKFFDTIGSQYVLDSEKVKNFFSNIRTKKEVVVEIGFGNGEHLLRLADRSSEMCIVGVELYRLGVVLATKKLYRNNINNTRITQMDARDFLEQVPFGSISQVYVLFPDPWRKARHNKRRMVKRPFMDQCIQALKTGGKCYIATDWAEYGHEIDNVMRNMEQEGLIDVVTYYISVKDFLHDTLEIYDILQTSFARRAQREGRDVIVFQIVKK